MCVNNFCYSVEFIGYYLDRNVRLTSMKHKLEELLEVNNQLQDEQQMLRHKYDQVRIVYLHTIMMYQNKC